MPAPVSGPEPRKLEQKNEKENSIVSIIGDLREFLARDLRIADAATLPEDYALVQRGVLDSIEVMQVVAFIEKTYGIQFDDLDVMPSNLGSLQAMSSFVQRKQAAAAGS